MFPLVSFFGKINEFRYEDWEISASAGELDHKELELISRNWDVPVEGSVLRLAKPGASLEEYVEKAIEVSTLLSLASGNSVAFHRQIYRAEDTNKLEIWRLGNGGEFGIGEGLPSYEHFLREVLPHWRSMTPHDRKLIRDATISLNNSARGYMEEKILNVTIAWEMLANAWTVHRRTLIQKIQELKDSLKESYNEWRLKYPEIDPSGVYFQRVSRALERDPVKEKIEHLARDFDIDSEAVGTNFRRLIQNRHSVAHSGLFAEEEYRENESRPIYKLLLSSQFALRVLLLKKLGYTGLISSSKGGWRTFVNIADAEFES